MITALLFGLISSAGATILGWVSSLVSFLFPDSFVTFFSAVGTIFGGLFVLNHFLPIQELLILSGAGIALNITLVTAYYTIGGFRFVLNAIFFWR